MFTCCYKLSCLHIVKIVMFTYCYKLSCLHVVTNCHVYILLKLSCLHIVTNCHVYKLLQIVMFTCCFVHKHSLCNIEQLLCILYFDRVKEKQVELGG